MQPDRVHYVPQRSQTTTEHIPPQQQGQSRTPCHVYYHADSVVEQAEEVYPAATTATQARSPRGVPLVIHGIHDSCASSLVGFPAQQTRLQECQDEENN